MSDTFYITTSIAYVNAKPHIGFAMELAQADVLARFYRLQDKDTFYLTGTDEHGLKLQQTAESEGVSPQELVDRNSSHFQALTQALQTSNDHFIRTTSPEHKNAVQTLWKTMVERGDIYKDSYEGLYCVGCEAFVLEKDLIEGKCPNHNREPEVLKEENWFFRLSKYNDAIREAIESGQLKIVPEARQNEILAVLKEGLKDVSFSRPTKVLQWGIQVPDDPDQVMYVWCDALSNYITGIGYGSDETKFKHFWPANVQLIGKDILRFHAAIWIGMLMSAGLPIPKAIYVHGFITSEGKKMSKSLQNVVDPFEYIEAYGADALRYYLLKEIPTTDDGDFSKQRFFTVYESELANTIGNLVSRVVAMTHKYCDGKVPANHHHNKELAEKVAALWTDYSDAVEAFDLKRALELVQEFAFFANKYVEDHKPWVLVKESMENLHQVLYDLLEMVRQIGLFLLPFLPSTATRILGYLGQTDVDSWDGQTPWGGLAEDTQLQKAEPLFMRKEG